MNKELQILKKEIEPYIGTLVLDAFFEVKMLSDVILHDDDFCWVYDTFDSIENQKCSCLIKWTPLKNLPDSDYQKLVQLWNFNAETFKSNKKAI